MSVKKYDRIHTFSSYELDGDPVKVIQKLQDVVDTNSSKYTRLYFEGEAFDYYGSNCFELSLMGEREETEEERILRLKKDRKLKEDRKDYIKEEEAKKLGLL